MFLNCIGRQTISSKFRFQKPPLKSPLIRRIAPPQVLILLLVLPLVLHFSVVFAATFGTVDAIEITGNNKTKPVAILQELSFKPGDKLTEKQLRRTKVHFSPAEKELIVQLLKPYLISFFFQI